MTSAVSRVDGAISGPVNLLVVDDHVENRIAVRAVLSGADYRIVEANSADEALKRLLEREFAVLLVDVVMPGVDGFELVRAVKERDRTASVPVLFLTAQATDLSLIYAGYRAGAVDYLLKPVVPEMLKAKVSVFAELYRQRKQIEQQSALLVEAEHKAAELAIMDLRMASERRYRTLAEAMPHIVWTAAADGTVIYFNHRWFEYTGITMERAAGSWEIAIHPEDLPSCRKSWQAATRTGQMFQVECRLRSAAPMNGAARPGAYRWHLGRAIPEKSASGQTLSWLGTFTDIDDQKRAQLARDEFLSVASHELRTPLSALQLALDMLLRTVRSAPETVISADQARSKLELARRQTERLTLLVSELLDVSRITAGRLRIAPVDLDLAAVVVEVAGRLADEAERAHSSIQVHASEPVYGRWDKLRMEQIVTNLLINAFKFGAEQPVDVRVEGNRESVHPPGHRPWRRHQPRGHRADLSALRAGTVRAGPWRPRAGPVHRPPDRHGPRWSHPRREPAR